MQVAVFLIVASGVPYLLPVASLNLSQFGDPFRLRFGFDVLKWIVLILLPLFLVFGLALVSYEIYHELSTSGGKGKQFRKLLASLRVPGASRSLADIQNIHAAISESEFLKPYPYSKLATICRKCELLELKPQEAVFSEGDTGDYFFVLIKGAVDVYVQGKAPPHTMKCVNTLHDSGSFGELALLQATPRRSRAFATSSTLHNAACKPHGIVAFCRNRANVLHRSSARRRRCSWRSTALHSST